MRQLVLGFIVFAATWMPAIGQPTAADSALVDDLLDALRFDRADATQDSARAFADALMPADQVRGSEALVRAMTDMTGLADSARVLFLADFRPELIRQAIDTLSVPALQAMYGSFQLHGYSAHETAKIMQDPGERPLADSVLVANYVDAVLTANAPSPEMQRELGRETYRMMVERMPASASDTFDGLGGEDWFLGLMEAQASQPAILPAQVRGLRALLHGFDTEAIQSLTRYYESDAGLYVSQVVGTASQRAMMPGAIQAMREMFESALAFDPSSSRESEPDVIEIDRSDDEHGVYEVVDSPPVLVGGLEGLMERVVYPEAARREDVEGRVFVQFVVDERGATVDATCVRSPDSRLCDAAVAAIKGSMFTPGTHEGRPVQVRYSIPVNFVLQDDEEPTGPAGRGADVYETVDTPPMVVRMGPVDYPEDARRAGVEGKVFVQFVVGVDGEVLDPSCMDSPPEILCKAALESARRTTFTPGSHEGQPVKVLYTLPISFALR